MPPGEQISFQPALAQVLAEHLHHAAVGREMVVSRLRSRPSSRRSSTSKTAPSRFDAVSSGPNRRKFAVRVESITSRRNVPRTRVASASTCPGRRTVDGVVAEIGQLQIPQQQPTVRVRIGAHAPVALRAQLGQLGNEPRHVVEELIGPIAPHPLLEHGAGAPGWSRPRRAEPGGTATSLRPACRRPPSGPVQPFGVRSTIIGQRARVGRRSRRRVVLNRADLVERPGRAWRPSLVHRFGGSSPSTKYGLVAVSPKACSARPRESGRGRSDPRSCSRSGAGSAERRRRCAGLRNLFECQLVASGPVSASPSPTTQTTIRSGLSNAAP